MTDQGWAIALGLGAIGAALLQAAVLVWQILYLRGTVSQMRQSERRQLRAYVAVEDARLIWTTEGPSFILAVANTGQTPARFFEIGLLAEMVPQGTAHNQPIPRVLNYKTWSALGGNRTLTSRVSPDNSDIRIDDLKDDNSAYLSARGRVRYGDIFNDVWESEFSFFIYGNRGNVKAADREKMSQPHGRLNVYQRA
jgi:hypothetical protein